MRLFVCALVLLSAGALRGATVYLPLEPEPAEVRAAQELRDYWEQLTGKPVRVAPETEAETERPRIRHPRQGGARSRGAAGPEEPSFFVGETRAGRLWAPLPEGMDRDGFVWRSRGSRTFIRGGSPEGVAFGVYRFLGEAGGIRWFWPTDLGVHLPEQVPVAPRGGRVVEEPDFLSRQWSAANAFSGDAWEQRTFARPRYTGYLHAVHRIFTEAIYDLRPDFFIMLNGERIRPVDAKGGHNYQICFGNPDAARFAARKAAEFFDANPEAADFPLGMTDTYPICQCGMCQEIVAGAGVFRHRPDYSDLIFTFMNRAAEELGRIHPDKYLSCLAYYWAENTPSFPVHPKVIPYLTADRSMWFDEAFRAEDMDLMRRWAAAGPEIIGIYDYYYGSSFVIPRLFTQITADSLRHAKELGIRGFFAELNSTWSLDGPKAWFTSQLLWDADQDRNGLLDDFYRSFFQEAAGPIRAFYEKAEEIWMSQTGPAFWLKFYHDLGQLELYPPSVCQELRLLLDEAEALAEGERVRQRVRMVSEGFRQTELYSRLYHLVKELGLSGEEAPADKIVAGLEELAGLKEELEGYFREVIQPNPLHRPTARIEQRAWFLPGHKVPRLLERLTRERGRDQGVEALALRLGELFPESRADVVWGLAGEEWEEVLLNGNFEQDALLMVEGESVAGDPGYAPLGWTRGFDGVNPPVLALAEDKTRSGPFALRAEGAVQDLLLQQFRAEPGRVYRFAAWAQGQVSPGSRVEIQVYWLDENGSQIEGEIQALDQLLPGRVERWVELVTFAPAPERAVTGLASLIVHHQAEGDVVHFDDLSVKRLRRVPRGR
jgi:hypothetical protein